uniref:Uncharacterized protein n=1 Tax=Melopsittacus undulatus TaxID=13146 RepID=A0A8V5GGZ3_MELUD
GTAPSMEHPLPVPMVQPAPWYPLLYGSTGPPGPLSRPRGSRRALSPQQLQVATQCHLLSSSAPIPTDPISFHHSPYGVFQLPPGDPFPEPVTVTWIQVMTLALALVCEPHENLALAELTLRRLAPRFLASLRLLDPGSNALLHPDAADGVLERLLPHGEMLFLNEGFIQGMDREMGIKRSR